jgi:hypothetical protein
MRPDHAAPTEAMRLLDDGHRDEALRRARAGLEAAHTPEATRAWAHVAEAAGHALLARAAWGRLLDQRPGDAEAEAALAELAPPSRPAPPPAVVGPPAATPADLLRFVALFGGREGVVARMWSRGAEVGYSPVQANLDPALAQAHLAGEQTLGSYVIHRDDTVSYVVFDIDIQSKALEAAWGDAQATEALRRQVHAAGLRLMRGLEQRGWSPLLVDSGFKGRHLWCFLDRRAPAGAARAAAHAALAAVGFAEPGLSVEIFPKQDRVPEGGLGNLVKLPMGVHLRTQRRCALLDAEGRPVADPFAALRALRRGPLPEPSRAAAPPPAAPEPAAPPRPAPTPGFSAGDLDALPRISAVLSGCAVLRAVVEGVLDGAPLDRDAALVVEHSLGHLPEGVGAVNWLCARAGLPEPMGRPHAGSPVSCARVRKRLPGVAQRVPCDCRFATRSSYEHPLLHAEGVAAEAPTPVQPPIEQQLRALASLDARLGALQAEHDALRRHVVDRLVALPEGALVVDGLRWSARRVEGLPVLERRSVGGA